jgi:hypothetical protein
MIGPLYHALYCSSLGSAKERREYSAGCSEGGAVAEEKIGAKVPLLAARLLTA